MRVRQEQHPAANMNEMVDKASKVIDVLEDPRASLARKQSQAESLESVTKGGNGMQVLLRANGFDRLFRVTQECMDCSEEEIDKTLTVLSLIARSLNNCWIENACTGIDQKLLQSIVTDMAVVLGSALEESALPDFLELVLITVENCCRACAPCQKEFSDSGGITPLVQLLGHELASVREKAVLCLCAVGQDNDVIIEEILTAGGIDMLVVLADVYDDYCVSKDGKQAVATPSNLNKAASRALMSFSLLNGTVQEIVQESGDTNALLTLLSAEMSHAEKIWAADTIAAVCEGPSGPDLVAKFAEGETGVLLISLFASSNDEVVASASSALYVLSEDRAHGEEFISMMIQSKAYNVLERKLGSLSHDPRKKARAEALFRKCCG